MNESTFHPFLSVIIGVLITAAIVLFFGWLYLRTAPIVETKEDLVDKDLDYLLDYDETESFYHT